MLPDHYRIKQIESFQSRKTEIFSSGLFISFHSCIFTMSGYLYIWKYCIYIYEDRNPPTCKSAQYLRMNPQPGLDSHYRPYPCFQPRNNQTIWCYDLQHLKPINRDYNFMYLTYLASLIFKNWLVLNMMPSAFK